MQWIDVKYANMLSTQVRNWKVKTQNPYLANFSCPLCGDSQKKKTKARGYLYTKKGSIFYKCHNCGIGTTLGKLLKSVASGLYDQYRVERYREGLDMGKSAKPDSKAEFAMEAPVFEEKCILDRLLDRLDSLPEDNAAVQYALSRQIPKEKFSELYYIDDIGRIGQLSPKYKDKIKGHEPRLVIPFYDKKGKLVGVNCRSLREEDQIKYVAVKIDEDADMVYNLDRIDDTKEVYVTEGPFDSMFLDNCAANNNASLTMVGRVIPKESCTLVFDNQPRNREVMKIVNRAAKDGWRMVVWPSTVEEKDLNDMVLAGHDVKKLVKENTFHGPALSMRLNEWSKWK